MGSFAVGYVRVSSKKQASDGCSIDIQKRAIETWCRCHGMYLGHVYVDAGVSGKSTDNRTELRWAVTHATWYEGVVVSYSVCRLTRNSNDARDILALLHRHKASAVSIVEGLDSRREADLGRFVAEAEFAEKEVDRITGRVTMAMDHKRRKGERISGRIPYGFNLADDGIKLIPDATEQATLQTIRDLRAAGATLRAIVDDLNRNSIPTKNGNAWNVSTVHGLLVKTKANRPIQPFARNV
jgi:site-specific DNA recombinase